MRKSSEVFCSIRSILGRSVAHRKSEFYASVITTNYARISNIPAQCQLAAAIEVVQNKKWCLTTQKGNKYLCWKNQHGDQILING